MSNNVPCPSSSGCLPLHVVLVSLMSLPEMVPMQRRRPCAEECAELAVAWTSVFCQRFSPGPRSPPFPSCQVAPLITCKNTSVISHPITQHKSPIYYKLPPVSKGFATAMKTGFSSLDSTMTSHLYIGILYFGFKALLNEFDIH